MFLFPAFTHPLLAAVRLLTLALGVNTDLKRLIIPLTIEAFRGAGIVVNS